MILQLLQRWFKPGSPLQDLRPTNAKPWRFLFVVPTDVACTFKSQKLKDDTPTNVWARKVHQYVLGLEERTTDLIRVQGSKRYAVKYLSFNTYDSVYIGSVVIQVKVSKEVRLTEGVCKDTGGIETIS